MIILEGREPLQPRASAGWEGQREKKVSVVLVVKALMPVEILGRSSVKSPIGNRSFGFNKT